VFDLAEAALPTGRERWVWLDVMGEADVIAI